MTPCGCPSAYPVGVALVWHAHPVTCTGCGVLVRGTVVADGLHLCPPCARGDAR